MAKGYALEFLIDKIHGAGEQYGGYAILDADNVVDSLFLLELNRAFDAGCHAVQGLRPRMSPGDNWVARLDYIAWGTASMELQGRDTLGLSCSLLGSAMAFSSDLLNQLGGWRAYSLMEDMEMQVLCVLHGFRISWWPEAIAYWERPSSMRQISHQRLRWLRGEIQVVRRYFRDLLLDGIRKADLHKLEHCLWISRTLLPRSALLAATFVMLLLSLTGPLSTLVLAWQVWVLMMVGYLLYSLLGLATQKADWRTYLALIFSPAFILMWLWLIVKNTFTRRVNW